MFKLTFRRHASFALCVGNRKQSPDTRSTFQFCDGLMVIVPNRSGNSVPPIGMT